jgi:signal transduction histidine kinase
MSKGFRERWQSNLDWKFEVSSQEDEIGQFNLSNDISRAMLGLLLLVIPITLLIFADFLIFNLSWEFYALAGMRTGLLIYTFFQVLFLKKVKKYSPYTKAMFIYALVLITSNIIVNATEPSNFVSQTIIIMLLVFVFYLVIPNKFIYQTTLGLIAIVSEDIIVLLGANATFMDLFSMFLSMLLAFTVAASSSWQLNKHREISFQDINERIKAEAKLDEYSKNLERIVEERTKALRDAERLATIGTTVGMVGHDIRNPLQAITGDLYLTKLDVAMLPDNETKRSMQESLEAIEQNIDYIDKIVADLQDYARPIKPNIKKIELEKIIKLIINKNMPKNIQTIYEIDADAKIINSDYDLLKRILMNLIINAIQAMPEGGKLSINARKELQNILIFVQDTGVGISEDAKPNIFKPMFTTKAKGQGFGLVVVKRLTEVLGGTVSFESDFGKGAKFIISLPT